MVCLCSVFILFSGFCVEETIMSYWQEKKYISNSLTVKEFNILFPISKYIPLYFNTKY